MKEYLTPSLPSQFITSLTSPSPSPSHEGISPHTLSLPLTPHTLHSHTVPPFSPLTSHPPSSHLTSLITLPPPQFMKEHLTPHTSHLTPHTSHLTPSPPHTLSPHTTHTFPPHEGVPPHTLTPHTSHNTTFTSQHHITWVGEGLQAGVQGRVKRDRVGS